MTNSNSAASAGDPRCDYFTPQEACWIHGLPATALNQARACKVLGSELLGGKQLIPGSAVRAFSRYLANLEVIRRLQVFLDEKPESCDGANEGQAGDQEANGTDEIV